MKILIVNFSDLKGGAARAAYRLHRSLVDHGVNSQMLVLNKTSDDYTVISEVSYARKLINRLLPFLDTLPLLFYKHKVSTLFSSSWISSRSIIKKINSINPDIVHLHWICGGMIKIKDIAQIKSQVVWSIHDNWAFTGGCHVKWNCDKYLHECGACPLLASNTTNDLSRKIWHRKNISFKKKDFLVVGLSRWINECSKSSSLLKNKEHVHLPNLINTKVFKPYNQINARELWNLPNNKKLLLFGAIGAISDINKGFHELNKALHSLEKKDIELLIFGSSEPENLPFSAFKTHYLGHLSDDVSLVSLYNAADFTIVPSLQENLSNVIMESLSCGTPVVAFDVGGNSDLIKHQHNGYLATARDANDLRKGIEWLLMNENYERISKNARDKIMKEFDADIVTSKYIKLYNSIIANKNSHRF